MKIPGADIWPALPTKGVSAISPIGTSVVMVAQTPTTSGLGKVSQVSVTKSGSPMVNTTGTDGAKGSKTVVKSGMKNLRQKEFQGVDERVENARRKLTDIQLLIADGKHQGLIVNSIRQSIQSLHGTTVISLLQPIPETYDLVDDIEVSIAENRNEEPDN
ncbi:hypothetical protein RND71_022923 [Anisodus tanguticus]|uniref:Uncharacterized protein n=1 Tax=Anisodus tanguticus TaxID=243964 RepID=A0AAE1RSZ2_9SOLA|nr:hypothetical protein RND71_022923 [Anisodus tanguticus]